jgi:large conductance mechanosensitive channel
VDAKKQLLSFAEEFRNFALKGSLIDLSVGLVIGTSFTAIVKSLVDNIIMPIVSIPISFFAKEGGGYTTWSLGGIQYGHFLGDVVNFLIVAFALFIFIVKFLGWIMRTKKEAPPPPLTKDQELLVEIRDLLKSQRS